MKLMLKFLTAPLILTLTLMVWICSTILYCSSFLFGLVSTVIGLLGLVVLSTYSVQNGLILLLIAFLVSPSGIPMAAAWILGRIQGLRYLLQDCVYR